MKKFLCFVFILTLVFSFTVNPSTAVAQQEQLPRVVVSENGRYLSTEDGKPFFYLGDTAWELFHRTTREEADLYLTNRANKGFNAIQCVLLAESDGLRVANSYGHKPLKNNDPNTPDVKDGANNDYWDHCDYIINKATELGLYVALLPTWGDKVELSWGVGPVVFTQGQTAYNYGRFVGERYKDYSNIIWILGGDRSTGYSHIWTPMAEGIADGVNGVNSYNNSADYSTTTMTFHPYGGTSSSSGYHNADWLDFNVYQSGHGEKNLYSIYNMATTDYNKTPTKPTFNAEPNYESHPINWNASNGYFNNYDVRKSFYWSVFSGGAGYTYGVHSIWQFYDAGRSPVNYPSDYWHRELDLPGSFEVTYGKNLMLSRPYFSRVPDKSLVESPDGWDSYVSSTRDSSGSYAMVYFPHETLSKKVYASRLSGTTINAWWYNPRDGKCYDENGSVTTEPAFSFEKVDRYFSPPGNTNNQDWVLVLDDASKGYSAPGVVEPYINPYTVEDGMLSGVTDTDVDAFKDSFEATSGITVSVYSGENEVEDGILATGMTVKISNGSKVLESFTVVIYGDINGDGITTSTDLLMSKRHVLSLDTLSGAYLVAADASRTNGITSADLVLIKRHILMLENISQE